MGSSCALRDEYQGARSRGGGAHGPDIVACRDGSTSGWHRAQPAAATGRSPRPTGPDPTGADPVTDGGRTGGRGPRSVGSCLPSGWSGRQWCGLHGTEAHDGAVQLDTGHVAVEAGVTLVEDAAGLGVQPVAVPGGR